MAPQIYFFDDQLRNDPTQYPEYQDLNISFIHIPDGNYTNDGNYFFQNNFYLNDHDAINGRVATPAELPNPNTSELTPYPFFRNSAFHIEPDDFEEYAHGDTLTLIFDWDQTMTLTNGMMLGDGNTLEEELAELIAYGDVPATWTTETLARWYLHDPDDENRIMNLKDFFEEVQQMNIPVFILTANVLPESKPNIMPDILRAALNLEISGLFRAGHGGGITKREAIRDIIIPAANDHWQAVANHWQTVANNVDEETVDAETPAKKKQKVGATAEGRGGGRKRCSKKRFRKNMICYKGTKRQLRRLRKKTRKLKIKLTKCSRRRLQKWKSTRKARKKRGGRKACNKSTRKR